MMAMTDWDRTNRNLAIEIVRTLNTSGFRAYFAGGCVRDQLLGAIPTDYDVATNATPQQIIQIFGSKNTLLVGAAFGVACVHKKIDGEQFNVEVATFRSDGVYLDGRRPSQVRFSSPEEDAQRRDFTINGMFFDPIKEQIYDFVGGQADLNEKIIRAIGDADSRIAEDRLRMVRAVRFAAKLSFKIEDITEKAVIKSSPFLSVVSAERLADELSKICSLKNASWAWSKLHEYGLLNTIWPQVSQAWAESPLTKDVTLKCFEKLTTRSLSVCSALAIWHLCSSNESDQNKALHRTELANEFAQHLKLSNDDREEIRYISCHIDDLIDATQRPWSQIQPIVVQPYFNNLMQCASIISSLMNLDPAGIEYVQKKVDVLGTKLNPNPLLTGTDLKNLGYQAGPLYRTILQDVRDRQLDDKLQDTSTAIDYVKTMYKL